MTFEPQRAEGGLFGAGRRSLSHQVQRTLEHLKSGMSEKQVAAAMQISPHTVHCYVKRLYQSFGVRSRAELLVRVLSDREPLDSD